MLERIYVDNFRCLVNFDFRPKKINLLVGANGSGKSTFLEALLALRGVVNGLPIGTALPTGTLAWWDRNAAQTFECEIRDPAGAQLYSYRFRATHPRDSGPAVIAEESLVCDSKPVLTFQKQQVTLVAEDGASQSFAFESGNSPLSAGMGNNKHAKRFRELFAAASLFKLNPWAIQARSSIESAGISTNGENFVDWIRDVALSDPSSYAAWQANVAAALPHLRGLRLQDLGAGGRLLTGMMSRPNSADQPIPFYDFSEGEKCLVVLHAIAATRQRNTMLSLDEPDNFLSLKEVQPVLRAIIEPTLGPSPQLFVVSHHPESIDYLAADSTWLFERPNGAHVRVSPFVFDREKGERASESVQAGMQ